MSNCRDLTTREPKNIRVDIDKFTATDTSKFKALTLQLMANYKKHCKVQIDKRRGGTTTYEKVYPRHGKSIIDEIDDVLAIHYGFTREEGEYIKRFDEKFRMDDY